MRVENMGKDFDKVMDKVMTVVTGFMLQYELEGLFAYQDDGKVRFSMLGDKHQVKCVELALKNGGL